MQVRAGLAVLVALAAAPAALADTIRVPSPGLPTIQDAVDWALPGDVILVAPGEYTEPVSLVGKTGIELRGVGWPVFSGGADIGIESASDVVVRGLDMDGTKVILVDVTDVSLVGMRFHDGDSAIIGFISTGLLVSRCQFRDVNGPGVSLEDALGIRVERCRFDDLAGFAVYLTDLSDGADGAVLSKNRVSRCGGGFHVEGDDMLVEDNRLAGLTAAGIDTQGLGGDSKRGTYRRNRIQTSSMWAIYAPGDGTVVERSTFVGGGIGAFGQGVRVLGNRVTAAVEQGIYVYGNAIVEKNQVRGAAAEGIAVVGDGTAVVGNTATGSGGPGLLVEASNCRVSKNRMTTLGDVGFLVNGTGNLVTENRVSGSVMFDLADTAAEGANTYVANRFGTIEFDYVP